MKDLGSVSPALVVNDVIVVQVMPGGSRNKESAPGYFRGFDVRTGKKLWKFHIVPKEGEPGYETWEEGQPKYVGNFGIWTMMAATPNLAMSTCGPRRPRTTSSAVNARAPAFRRKPRMPRRENRTKGLALPDRTSWRVGLRQAGRADPARHRQGRKTHQGGDVLTKQGHLRLQPRDRKAGVADRGASGAAGRRHTRRGNFRRPSPFHQARPISETGLRREQPDRLHPGASRRSIEIMSKYTKGPIYKPPSEVTPTYAGTLVNPGYGGGATGTARRSIRRRAHVHPHPSQP